VKLKTFVLIIIGITLVLTFCFMHLFNIEVMIIELLKLYWFPICISIIGGILVKVISWLFKRAKAGISRPVRVILQKDCEDCEGKGYVVCEACNGSGQVKKEIVSSVKCEICNGSGMLKTTCPTCYGEKTIKKTLRFEVLSSETTVDGILFWPRTQIITIKLRNTDEKAGFFEVAVNLKDPSNSSKKKKAFIEPGNIRDIEVRFPADRWEGYASTFDVEAEAPLFTCPTCGGLGYYQRPCTTCGGTGRITEKKQQIEVCSKCGGKGEIPCKTCNGTGKVPRFS
jgi:hypothetical protein